MRKTHFKKLKYGEASTIVAPPLAHASMVGACNGGGVPIVDTSSYFFKKKIEFHLLICQISLEMVLSAKWLEVILP